MVKKKVPEPIAALQTAAGIRPWTESDTNSACGAVVWDVAGDGKKRLPEAIDALQVVSGIISLPE